MAPLSSYLVRELSEGDVEEDFLAMKVRVNCKKDFLC